MTTPINPYEPPLIPTSPEPRARRPREYRWALEIFMVCGLVLLLVAATLHRLQLDSPTYTSSSLIGVEIVALLAAFRFLSLRCFARSISPLTVAGSVRR